MELPTYFADFLRNIRPTSAQRSDAATAHNKLRSLLLADKELERYVITTFLQGSYRRSTDIKPTKGKKSDVDVIAVTNMHKDQFPDGASALEEFRPFLDAHYPRSYEPQSHSWGLIDGEVELDLVPTSAPSESVEHELRRLRESKASVTPGLEFFGDIREALSIREAAASGNEWRAEPLEIPDRDRRSWELTHPLAQIAWTAEKNDACNGHFVNVVRAAKWWWLRVAGKSQPKSYLLEAIVGVCIPDGIESIAVGFLQFCDDVTRRFVADVNQSRVPFISDHGIPQNNVLARLNFEDFHSFYTAVQDLLPIARRAYESQDRVESVGLWRHIFGEEFPGDGGNGGSEYPSPPRPAEPRRERFAR